MILFPQWFVEFLVYAALAFTVLSTLRLWWMLASDWKNGRLW